VIRIPENLLEETFVHARRPGSMRFEPMRRDVLVERVYPVPNGSDTPETRFVMEPESQISGDAGDTGLRARDRRYVPFASEKSGAAFGAEPEPRATRRSLSDGEARWWRITATEAVEVERGTPLM
jgi:hypothetical protein